MKVSELFIGAALGAGLMYLFDPHAGSRRRALLSDQLAGMRAGAADRLENVREEAEHWASEIAAEIKPRAEGEAPSDRLLRDRVRAELNGALTYASAIRVDVSDGHVTLSGPILAYDLPTALGAARRVDGVKGISDHLDIHQTPANLPDFQATSWSEDQPGCGG